jgi:GT2 family glycosyltransferase
MLMRADAVRKLLTAKAELVDAADLAWQVLAQVWRDGAQAIVHVPRVLYHFHSPLHASEQQSRLRASRKALARVEPHAVLEEMPSPPVDSLFVPRRLHRSLAKSARTKTISLIIPTRDRVELLQRCLASLERFTDMANLEIIVVDNDSAQTKTKTYLRQVIRKGIRVLPFPGAFNFSAMNNRAVAAASGEIVGLINNDIEALHEGWLEEMLSHLLSPGVGAVGAKLLWPNGMVQHGGVLMGLGHAAGHFGNLLMDQDWGDHGRNQLVQQVSGVTAACLLVRKKDYLAVGGLDETAFPVAFNDVDFCLKLRSLEKSIVWTPHARLIHAESASRGHEDTPQKKARAQREIQELRRRWFDVLSRDPAYHPSLSLDSHSQAFGGLALPPRDRSPRSSQLRQSSLAD